MGHSWEHTQPWPAADHRPPESFEIWLSVIQPTTCGVRSKVTALLWTDTITPGAVGSATGFQLLPPAPLLLGTARTLLSVGWFLNNTAIKKQKNRGFKVGLGLHKTPASSSQMGPFRARVNTGSWACLNRQKWTALGLSYPPDWNSPGFSLPQILCQ